MLVKAAPGIRVPMEGRATTYITGTDPVQVPDTAYYRRMVNEGSLVLVSEAVPEKTGSRNEDRGTRKKTRSKEQGARSEENPEEPNIQPQTSDLEPVTTERSNDK